MKYERWESSGDFLLKKEKIILFVHGCFWHGCDVHYNEPKTNVSFWRKKLNTNRIRDINGVSKNLRDGYSIIIIWEHAIKFIDANKLNKIIKFSKNKNLYLEINK